MKTSLFVLSALLSGIALTEARASQRFVMEEPETVTDPSYSLQGLRGMWVGYQTGFYKNTKKEAGQCLNDETTHNIANILNFLNGSGDMSQAFALITEGMQVMGNLQVDCGFE